jgi:predicted nucleotidyltransferase
MIQKVTMKITQPLDDIFQNKSNVRVLRQLILFPSKVTTGRGLAKELDMNHATCIRALNALVALGVISRRSVGKSSVYEFPSDSVLYKEFLKPLFEKEDNLLNDLVGILSKGIRQNIQSIYLFGSVARAEDTSESDIDIAFILKSGVDKGRAEEVLGINERAVYRLYQIGTNALVYTSEEFESMKRKGHSLVKEILSEGVLLVGKEQ